jgi:DUF177 domain-containing protein
VILVKVNIGSIREIPGGMLDFKGEQEVPDYKMDLTFTGPTAVQGTITNIGEGFLVKAKLQFQYKVNCSRCLKEFVNSQETEVIEQFLSTPITEQEDDLAFHFSGDIIDLKDCISEQVLFALPMSFICTAECRGLCPTCGKNLNHDQCECIPEQINPQFEKLRNLLSKEGGGVSGKSKK